MPTPTNFKFRLMSTSGVVYYFFSAAQFCRETRHLADEIGQDFSRTTQGIGGGVPVAECRPVLFRLTDANGEPIDPGEVYREGWLEIAREKSAEREAFERANPRRQPGRRWRKSHYYRAPRCLPALRQIAGWLSEEGEPKPRQGLWEVPTQWDDLHRVLERNWKRFRKTRWKDGKSKK